MKKQIENPIKKGDKVRCIAVVSIGGSPSLDFCKHDKLKIGKEYTASMTQRLYRCGADSPKDWAKTQVIRLEGCEKAHRVSNFVKITP